MTFEIFRYGTQFCWRLLDQSSNLICTGNKQRRLKHQTEEDVLVLMDKIKDATIIDKTSVSTHIKDSGPKGARAKA